ncbi:uncharacterized protein [Penaeus vannamei]|uniref:uncharacterized protein n=1 Tax=Penaeus vannamei TaxID=6689 RepID=UPI00387F673D
MIILPLLLFLPAHTTATFGLLANLTSALSDATFTIELGTTACEGFLSNATSALLSGTPLNITFNDFFLSAITSLQSLEETNPRTRLFFNFGSRWTSWRDRLANLTLTWRPGFFLGRLFG